MRLNNLTVDQFNAEMYDAATRFVTWDLDNIRSLGVNYIGKQTYKFYTLSDGTYQVAYSRCPSSTGYNVIPLNVPAVGTVVSTLFTALQPGSALAPGDPGECKDGDQTITVTNYNSSDIGRAAWRYGYVALLKNGQRIYSEMNRKTKAQVNFTIPENCEKLWFVVVGAPNTYEVLPWDEKEINDDQWPYTVKFSNTDIYGNITFDGTETHQNVSLMYNVTFPVSAYEYSGTVVKIEGEDLIKLAKSFVLQPSEISNLVGKSITFYALEPDGTLNSHYTANGYGHWFDKNGRVCAWGTDAKVFSEYNASNFEFSLGQYPGHCASGDHYTIKQALVYEYESGKTIQAIFTFNITIE